MSRRSFALGRSPRLIAGYMAQLHQLGESQKTIHTFSQQVDDAEHVAPPALVVMGEDSLKVEEQPHGYTFDQGAVRTSMKENCRLVTLDRVWWLLDDHDVLLRSQSSKDLCLSFSMFKLLRCRFAKYTIFGTDFAKTQKFIQRVLLQGDDYERAFRVIEDELCFIHNYYYSSLPVSYSNHLFPILSIALSLYSVGYCFYLVVFITQAFDDVVVFCQLWCLGSAKCGYEFEIIPFEQLISYVNHASWQRSAAAQKCISFVFKECKCRLVNNWADKINLCSVLVPDHHLWDVLLLRGVLCLPIKNTIKVPTAVKEAIFKTLKVLITKQESLVPQYIHPPFSPVADNYASTRDGEQTAYTILVWHIATSILEINSQVLEDSEEHNNKVAATHLSHYCAYLVCYHPELLPGDDAWCKKLYNDVKKDAGRILAAAKAEYHHQQLVQVLSANSSNHEVLRHDARLAKQMIDSGTGWEALARFWSEMILYVAPSENLEGHAEAIARGGELITLLWVLLAHAGIVGRLNLPATT